jgi:DmsE family decaheme c-type cytochrome
MRFRSVLLFLLAAVTAGAAQAAAHGPTAALPLMSMHAVSADQGAPAPAPQAKTQPVAAKADGDYVGSETCLACHEDQHKRFNNTVMGKIFAKPRNALEARGCEACHGPGKAHVDAGGGKETIPLRFGEDSRQSADEQNAACLQCHEKGNRMFWRGSPHESRGLRCVDCHQVMGGPTVALTADRFGAPLTENQSMKKTQPELCLQCHQMRRAQLQRSSHMPFREGKVTCSSCHNPHGSPNPKQLIRATVNENCYSCHAERRGPFLWEHPPVLENCMNCHEAHGSSNPQLLTMRAPRLCQRCHINSGHPGQVWGATAPTAPAGAPATNAAQSAGLATRVLNRGCTNCHAQIHGSNHPSGKAYLR